MFRGDDRRGRQQEGKGEPLGFIKWKILGKRAEKSPMTGKVQSWGKQTQSDIFEGKE